jgi:hypothetical protein
MASTVFFDDFETGVLGSKWTTVNAGQSLLVGDSAHAFGTQSAKQVNAFTNGVTDVYYMRTQPGTVATGGTVAPGTKEVASVEFWDDNIRTDQNGDGSIDIKGALMLAQDGGGGTTNDFYQLGVNSPTSVNDYFWRTSAQGLFDSGVARTVGWHELRIEVLPYTGTNDVNFYIDNALVASGNRKPNTGSGYDMNEVRLGLSARTPDSAFWFDNVSVSIVPEPATLPLLALGLIGLAFFRRRLVNCGA